MWMFLGPCLVSALSSGELPSAGWCGKEDDPALGSRVVTRDDGLLLAVTSR